MSRSDHIVAAARDLDRAPDPQATMDLAVSLAVELVLGAEQASITLIRRRRGRRQLETPAYTSRAGKLLDELQYKFEEGPCYDAVHHHEVNYSPDIGTDERWPLWGPLAVEATSVRSMLCLRLFTHSNLVGAINLHSETPGGFDQRDIDDAVAVAAHAAIAVSAAAKVENLTAALDTRTITGQATGIIMGRYDLDAAAAFAVLARLSSHSNRRLVDVAAQVIELRGVPQD